MITESKLWQQINALGGVPANEYDRGFNDAILEVLALIEADELAAHEFGADHFVRGADLSVTPQIAAE